MPQRALDLVSVPRNYVLKRKGIGHGYSDLHIERALPGPEGRPGVARASLRLRGYDGHRGAPGGPRDVPLRDERRRARADHDWRAVGGVGEEPQEPGRRQHAVGPRHARAGTWTRTAHGRGPRAGTSSPNPRSSSTAIECTGSPTSRGTGGPSRSTCATCHAPKRRRRSATRSWPRTGRERAGQTDSTTRLPRSPIRPGVGPSSCSRTSRDALANWLARSGSPPRR